MKSDDYVPKKETKLHVHNAAKDPKEIPINQDVKTPKDNTSKSVIDELTEQSDTAWKHMTVKEKIQTIAKSDTNIPNIELSNKDKEILRKLELEHEKNIKNKTESSFFSTEAHEKKYVKTEPIEKPKAKLSIRPKQSVCIKF